MYQLKKIVNQFEKIVLKGEGIKFFRLGISPGEVPTETKI